MTLHSHRVQWQTYSQNNLGVDHISRARLHSIVDYFNTTTNDTKIVFALEAHFTHLKSALISQSLMLVDNRRGSYNPVVLLARRAVLLTSGLSSSRRAQPSGRLM